VLRSANGKAFTPSAAAEAAERFADWPAQGRNRAEVRGEGVDLRRAVPKSSLRFWFFGSLALLAALFFLLGVDGAEKRLDAGFASGSAAPAAEPRLF
jgi:hypothetical protein